ncbi:excitatory amino acid transporter 2 isoform X2 [Bemisia tabaci]|uniref:excitatory amino acid transporter 2 isoform X2 n=1 Tax=Bemisia tabaci TaxID=7038 RepID=UPI003B27DE93
MPFFQNSWWMFEVPVDEAMATDIEEGQGTPIKDRILGEAKKQKFLIYTLLGVIIGGILGCSLRSFELERDTITVISYPGEIFLRALKLLILPFVATSLIIGTASLNIQKNGKIAVRTIVYFTVTTFINVAMGIILVLLIHPGDPSRKAQVSKQFDSNQQDVLDGLLDIGRNLFPDNLFAATMESTYTKYTNSTKRIGMIDKKVDTRRGTNMLGIICFCVMFGSVLGTMEGKKRAILDLLNVTYDVLMRILNAVIWFTPLAVGSIICGKIITISDFGLVASQLALFTFTILFGFALYHFVIAQAIYYVLIGESPLKYYLKLGPALLTAFATASKAASLPITYKLMDEKLKMNPKVTRFVLPLGSVNMDGSSFYLVVAVIFIAQMNNIALGVSDYFSLLITATFISMSNASIPSAILVLVVMLCGFINAPTTDVSLLYAIDWFLDRFRTPNNLLGDCYTIAVVQKLSTKELAAADMLELNEGYVNPAMTVITDKTEENGTKNNHVV